MMKHPSQLAPEGRDKLHRMLVKGAQLLPKERLAVLVAGAAPRNKLERDALEQSKQGGARAISFKQFMKVMHVQLAQELAAKNRFEGGSPHMKGPAEKWRKWLTEEQAAAWFLKVGHDDKGRMPIDVFVRRLFSGEAHVMSLEGAREGAFPRDKSRRYKDYLWKWQGMIQNAPRFAKSGVYTPSDWEDYFTLALKTLEEKPEAFLKLEHVHGFSGLLNTSNNLFYSRRGPAGSNQYGCLVYYAAAVGIVCSYDKDKDPALSPASLEVRKSKRSLEGDYQGEDPTQEQKFFLKHTDDITAIAMHPGRKIAATGQKCGPWSSVGAAKIISLSAEEKKKTLVSPVFIWDELTRSGPYGWKKPVQINLPQKEGLSCMAFSQVPLGRLARLPDYDDHAGDVLLTVSKDSDHTVNLWHWRNDAEGGKFPVLTVPTCSETGMKGTPPQVYGCAFNPFLDGMDRCHRSTFATWGKMHVTFWHYDEAEGPGAAMDEGGSSERSADQYGNIRPSVQASISGKPAMFTTPGTSTANAEKQDVLCLCYLPMNMVLVGGPNGSITVLAHPEEADDGLTAKQQANQRKALQEKRVNLKKLDMRRELKTVAVQEIQNAHAPGKRIKDGTNEGQWGIKDGGCTALVLAETWDVVFSGGGDGRIVEWQLSPEGLDGGTGISLAKRPRLKMSAGVDMLTPLREFDARLEDRTGPPRMFIGMDCCQFQVEGGTERRICAGDTENDIWEIVQEAATEEGPYTPKRTGDAKSELSFLLEGQSASVQGVAPYPEHPGGEKATPMGHIYATACEDGHVYVYDANKRSHLRKHEIRRHGGITGTHVPRGCNVGDLLMARACAFSPDGTMLAVSTSGVRQKSERVTVTLPAWVDPEKKLDVWIQVKRLRGGAVDEVNAFETKPDEDKDGNCDLFEYALPPGSRPYMDLAIDVPLDYVKLKGGFGELTAREDVPEDLGGVIQIWYFKQGAEKGWGDQDDVQMDGYEKRAPVLLYEEKVSIEEIDVLTFSSDSTMLAAGSHDNFTYVLGKACLPGADPDEPWKADTDFADVKGVSEVFERVGVCARHSSYIKCVDWSEADPDGRYLLQTVCGAYETLFFRPERDRDTRMHSSKMLALSNGEVWPVCEQICANQRDRKWDTWTSTLGFPVMGIWEPDMDGTDINACDRSPLLRGKTLREVVTADAPGGAFSRGHIVTANDDGTVGLYHYPSVLGDYATGDPKRRESETHLVTTDRSASMHHSFRGHASHVMCVRFLSDARRVVSAGGLDRTTFQWNTHGIKSPSRHFAAAAKVRTEMEQAQQGRVERSQKMRESIRASQSAGPAAGRNRGPRKSTQLRKKEKGACCLTSPYLPHYALQLAHSFEPPPPLS